jgi:hypothetical protein
MSDHSLDFVAPDWQRSETSWNDEVQKPMSHEKPRRHEKNSAQNERAGYLLNFFAAALATRIAQTKAGCRVLADFSGFRTKAKCSASKGRIRWQRAS